MMLTFMFMLLDIFKLLPTIVSMRERERKGERKRQRKRQRGGEMVMERGRNYHF